MWYRELFTTASLLVASALAHEPLTADKAEEDINTKE